MRIERRLCILNMIDNIGELGIFIAGCTVMIELATIALVECYGVSQGLCRLIDSVSSVTMIVNSLYFLSINNIISYKNTPRINTGKSYEDWILINMAVATQRTRHVFKRP